MWPFALRSLNQATHFSKCCCISSGEPDVLRPRKRYVNSLIAVPPLFSFHVEDACRRGHRPRLKTQPLLIKSRSCRRIDHGSRQHARALRRNQYGCVRGVLDCRWDSEKVGLRDLSHCLVFGDVQLAGQKTHRVLNGPAIGVGQRSKAYGPDTKVADLERKIRDEILHCAKRCADSGSARHMRPGWAARHKNDYARMLLYH